MTAGIAIGALAGFVLGRAHAARSRRRMINRIIEDRDDASLEWL